MKTTKIKCCPFCGNEVEIKATGDPLVFAVWHKDTSCLMVAPMWISANTLDRATWFWNRRVEEDKNEDIN